MNLGHLPTWFFQCNYQSEMHESPVYYTANIQAANYLEACKEFMMDVLLKAPGFVDVLKVKAERVDDEA